MNVAVLREIGLPEVDIDPGTVLIEEGRRGRSVFVLISGKVTVRSKGHQVAEVDDPGAILGEVSALMGTDPVATVTAVEKSTFYVMDDFLDFCREHPEACLSVAQVLACRLVNMNNHFVYVKEQLGSLQDSLRNYKPVFPENYQT